MTEKTALLAGASGLVGGELLNILLASSKYSKVIVIVRRALGVNHPKLEEHVIDFDNLAHYRDCFNVNDIYCCLGTTIKKAKSREAFKKVDVHYPLEIARLAKEMGAEKYLVISSIGANPKSKVFYSSMKGTLEESLKEIGFKYLHIFRPSLLIGDRKEFRLGESITASISKCIQSLIPKMYKPIEANLVATGMYKAAQASSEGIYTYSNTELLTEVI